MQQDTQPDDHFTAPLSPHRNKILQVKNDLRFLKETTDSCALTINENKANMTKNLHYGHTGDSHEESTVNSSDIGYSNEEDEPLELNETSSEN